MEPTCIVLYISATYQYSRDVLRGMLDYARGRPDWQLLSPAGGYFLPLGPGHLDRADGSVLLDWGMPETVMERLPRTTVGASEAGDAWGIPTACLDNHAIGVAAAEYFLGLGFRDVAFVGLAPRPFSVERERGFVETLAGAGIVPRIHQLVGWPDGAAAWHQEQAKKEVVLRSLPAPCGVFAVDDTVGASLVTLAREVGVGVPEDLSILGVNDDEVICDAVRPALSSIRVSGRGVGFAAGELLAERLADPGCPARKRVIGGHRLHLRESSGPSFARDPALRKALHYMHTHFRDGPRVDEVARHAGVCRRTLEIRCKQALGRTPHQELRRIQLSYIRQRLAATDEPLEAIARSHGIRDAAELCTLFKRAEGITPGAYRRRHAGGE